MWNSLEHLDPIVNGMPDKEETLLNLHMSIYSCQNWQFREWKILNWMTDKKK